jgi:hypothetical protein
MKLDNYTPEIFFETYSKDCIELGEETAKAIYEEVFSAICNKKITLDNFSKGYDSLMKAEKMLMESSAPDARMQEAIANAEHARQVALASQKAQGLTLQAVANMTNAAAEQGGIPAADMAFLNDVKNEIYAKSDKAAAEAFNSTMEQIAKRTASQNVVDTAKVGLLTKIGRFITTLPTKVKTFFGSLQGKSFSEIMHKGMSWLAANPALALKTTGGIALVALLIRALKKKGQLRDYANLARIEARARTLKEDCYDTYEDTKEKEAMRKILEECKTNKRLAEVILG